jgi:hypothetical protein
VRAPNLHGGERAGIYAGHQVNTAGCFKVHGRRGHCEINPLIAQAFLEALTQKPVSALRSVAKQRYLGISESGSCFFY